MSNLNKKYNNLHYLSEENSISLSENIGIIGHNGWYDAGWRTPILPFVFLVDWYFIHDFRFNDSNVNRISLMKYKASVATENLKFKLEKSLKTYHTIYLLTHFPPWPEKNSGGMVEKFWMPYNSSKIVADMLMATMQKYPNQNLIVLSGHVHPKNTYKMKISPNIDCYIGRALSDVSKIDTIVFNSNNVII